MISNVERQAIIETFQTRLRTDGRTLKEFRNLKIDVGEADRKGASKCYVSLGETQAVATVSGEIVPPYEDRPTEGNFSISASITQLAISDSEMDSRQRGKESTRISSILDQALREAQCLDIETLCIVGGSKVWSIKVDVQITNYDGNPVDAAGIAALGALISFRKPEVSVVGESVTVYDIEDQEPVRLAIQQLPLCVTFGLYRQVSENYDETLYILADPTYREERVINGSITVVINPFGEICGLNKQGWPPITNKELEYCVEIASRQSKEWAKLLKQ